MMKNGGNLENTADTGNNRDENSWKISRKNLVGGAKTSEEPVE